MKESIISRTFKQSIVDVLKVDVDSRTVKEVKIAIDSKYDTTESAEKYLRKTDTTIVSVLSVEVKEELRGMLETDFVKYGKSYEIRSKDNRGMVSKEVTIKTASVMVVNDKREVVDISVPFAGTEKGLRKACADIGVTFVKLNRIEESKQLVCMSQSDFYKLSKPMVDRFTLAK